jgi:hypothetical protein
MLQQLLLVFQMTGQYLKVGHNSFLPLHILPSDTVQNHVQIQHANYFVSTVPTNVPKKILIFVWTGQLLTAASVGHMF